MIAGRPKGGKSVKTRVEVARHFGVSEEAVRKWFGRGCPPGPPYNLDKIKEWHDGRKRVRAEKSASTTNAAIERAILLEDLAMKRLKRREKQGQLVKRDAVLSVNSKLHTEIKAILQSAPAEICDGLSEEVRSETSAVLSERIALVLGKMAEVSI